MSATNCLFFFLLVHSFSLSRLRSHSQIIWVSCLQTFYTYFSTFYYSFLLYIKQKYYIFMYELMRIFAFKRTQHLWPEHTHTLKLDFHATEADCLQCYAENLAFYLFYSVFTFYLYGGLLELDLHRRICDVTKYTRTRKSTKHLVIS